METGDPVETSARQSVALQKSPDVDEAGLSKLQLLRNQFRTKMVQEKERKLNLLNKKQAAANQSRAHGEAFGKQNRKVGPFKYFTCQSCFVLRVELCSNRSVNRSQTAVNQTV